MLKQENSPTDNSKKLYRGQQDRVVAGVASGLGLYFNTDPTIIRVLFIVSCIWGGFGLFLYLVLWLVMPAGPNQKISEESFRNNLEEVTEKAEELADMVNVSNSRAHVWIGLIIILVGIMLFFDSFGFFDLINLLNLWPLFLVGLGLLILFKDK